MLRNKTEFVFNGKAYLNPTFLALQCICEDAFPSCRDNYPAVKINKLDSLTWIDDSVWRVVEIEFVVWALAQYITGWGSIVPKKVGLANANEVPWNINNIVKRLEQNIP